MRISAWMSDVFSSDLPIVQGRVDILVVLPPAVGRLEIQVGMRIPGKTATPGYAVEVVVRVLVAVAVLVADPAEQRELGGQGIAQAEIGAGRADVALVGADLLADDVRPGPAEVGEVRPAVDRPPATVPV